MRHRAALVGAALALGAFALIAGPSSAATVGILSLVDAGCCSIPDGSKLQDNPTATAGEAGDPVTVNDPWNDGSERPGDSLGPDAAADTARAGLDANSPDVVSSVAAPESSLLTRVLMMFADLRSTVLGGPASGP